MATSTAQKYEAEDRLLRDGFVLQDDGSWYDEDSFLWAYVEPLEW